MEHTMDYFMLSVFCHKTREFCDLDNFEKKYVWYTCNHGYFGTRVEINRNLYSHFVLMIFETIKSVCQNDLFFLLKWTVCSFGHCLTNLLQKKSPLRALCQARCNLPGYRFQIAVFITYPSSWRSYALQNSDQSQSIWLKATHVRPAYWLKCVSGLPMAQQVTSPEYCYFNLW